MATALAKEAGVGLEEEEAELVAAEMEAAEQADQGEAWADWADEEV